jgi:hypothetical protein
MTDHFIRDLKQRKRLLSERTQNHTEEASFKTVPRAWWPARRPLTKPSGVTVKPNSSRNMCMSFNDWSIWSKLYTHIGEAYGFTKKKKKRKLILSLYPKDWTQTPIRLPYRLFVRIQLSGRCRYLLLLGIPKIRLRSFVRLNFAIQQAVLFTKKKGGEREEKKTGMRHQRLTW